MPDFKPVMKDYKKLTPFKFQILQSFPFIAEDFDSLTNYELLCKVVEYLNDVISNENNVEENVTNLYNSFVELQDYVNDYFDNLDVQNEVNNKLDEMTEDGTIPTIIDGIVIPILNNMTSEVNNLIAEADSTINNIETKIDRLRGEFYNQYHELELPGNPNLPDFFKIIKIFESNDKKNYKTNLDINSLKFTGGNTYYVSPNVSSGGDGSINSPYNRIYDAVNTASNGDTIILLSGIYRRVNYGFDNVRYIEKNINIIGENNVYLTTSDSLTWAQNSTYNNVYQASRTGVANVIDISGRKNNVFEKLTEVTSLEECSNNLNSYFTESGNVYVNNGNVVTNDNICVGLEIGYSVLPIHPTSANNTVYLENLVCISGAQSVISMYSSSNAKPTIYANKCKFLYCESSNAISVLGSNTIFVGCEASYARLDGFNYHASNNKNCYSIEIDCFAGNNGRISSQLNNNGSTTHDGNKIIRINGTYFNNRGGNIADVNDNTISININCNCFDSLANSDNIYDTDFCCQQPGVTMYLYNCFAKGSKSFKNLYCLSETTMYVSNCKYDTITGGGNIIYLDE